MTNNYSRCSDLWQVALRPKKTILRQNRMKVLVGEQQKGMWEGIWGVGRDQGQKFGVLFRANGQEANGKAWCELYTPGCRKGNGALPRPAVEEAGTVALAWLPRAYLACCGEASYGRGAQLTPSGTAGNGQPWRDGHETGPGPVESDMHPGENWGRLLTVMGGGWLPKRGWDPAMLSS